jgi:predicted GNAT superfamily acetyltransferase
MISKLDNTHTDQMLQINEQGLPGTGKVNLQEMQNLLELSELSLGVFDDKKLLGFIICLLPKTDYGSLNYAWFNERYDEFIYVDRIAVAIDARNQGIGSILYDRVFEYAKTNNIPVTAEVNLRPPNQGSDRFHLRHGYQVVGELDHGEKAVTMYIKHFPSSND